MKLTTEQAEELAALSRKVRADIPFLVDTMVPPEHRAATLRVMLSVVPPIYLSMALEKMHGRSPYDAQSTAIWALAVGISGIVSMTSKPDKTAETAAAMVAILGKMLAKWAAADETPLSKH